MSSFWSRYEREKELGVGHHGCVYRVRDTLTNQYFAAKVAPAPEEETGRQLENEFRLLLALDHPNVVHVNRLFHGEKEYVLLMELVEDPKPASQLTREQKISFCKQLLEVI